MNAKTVLATGATGKTGLNTVRRLVENGVSVRAMLRKESDRSEVVRHAGADVVVGNLLDHDDVRRAAQGAATAYFCYPLQPGLLQATAYFADAAKRAGLDAVVNMSQISAREDSESHAARDHWLAERILDSAFRRFTSVRLQHFCAAAVDYQNGLFSGEDKIIAALK